jgi:hypothetical protein
MGLLDPLRDRSGDIQHAEKMEGEVDLATSIFLAFPIVRITLHINGYITYQGKTTQKEPDRQKQELVPSRRCATALVRKAARVA